MTACPAVPSSRRTATIAVRPSTSARACAWAAIPAALNASAPAGAVWRGGCIGGTTGGAGRAAGGRVTIPKGFATTAAARPASANGGPAGCAWNRLGCPKSPAVPSTSPARQSRASSCSWPTCTSSVTRPRGWGPRGVASTARHESGSLPPTGSSQPSSTSIPTPTWSASAPWSKTANSPATAPSSSASTPHGSGGAYGSATT